MKNPFKKIKERWQAHKKGHKDSSSMLEDAARATTVGGVTAGTGFVLFNLGGAGLLSSIGASAFLAGSGIAALIAPVLAGAAGIKYLQEKKLNKTIETIKNPAGQIVQGPHWALACLKEAQYEIMELTDTFNKSAADSPEVQSKIDAVIASTADAQKHVVVVSPGEHGADKDKYQFIRVRKDRDLI